MDSFDVAVIGAGPAGSSCAAFCARHGLEVALIDRAAFPRHKVCGDCLNPACWEIFDKLELSQDLLAAAHVPLTTLILETSTGRSVHIDLPPPPHGEIAVKREILDLLLLQKAVALGASAHTSSPLTHIEKSASAWTLHTDSSSLRTRFLVAADGRNSTVARLLRLAGKTRPQRVAFQTHVPLPSSLRHTVLLKILPEGYCGCNPVNDSELNLCLVSRTDTIPDIKHWAGRTFALPHSAKWTSVTPLERADRNPAPAQNLFFVGDAARVVEPFTGEGIYYALHTGQLAARAIIDQIEKDTATSQILDRFHAQYHALYRDRLWVNRLTRAAVTNPALGNFLVNTGKHLPHLLPYLTSKIIRQESR